MEEYINLLKSTLIKTNNITDTSFLDDYFQLLKANDYLKILQNDDEWNLFFYSFEEIYSFNKFKVLYEESMQDTLANLIFSMLKVENKNDKIKLIPLFFYLDDENIFRQYLLDNHFFDALEDFMINTIEHAQLNLSNNTNLSTYNWELQSYNNYVNGINTQNIKQIYHFIESYEKGNGQFILGTNEFINLCITSLYRLSFNSLLQILNQQQYPLTIITFIRNLAIEQKLQLASQSTNKLLQFEAVRETVYFQNNNYISLNLLKNENELLVQIIIELSKDINIWEQFLEFYLGYPSRASQLFMPLGKALKQIDSFSVNIFLDKININQFVDDISKSSLNNCIAHINDDELEKNILEKIFFRWLDFIDTYNDFFSGIILTNVIDIAINYITNFIDEKIIEDNVRKILNDIDEIDTKWFKTITEQHNYFYKQMSKLFVYGFAIEKYQLDNIKNSIERICNNSLELKYEYAHNKKNSLQLFNEYILKI